MHGQRKYQLFISCIFAYKLQGLPPWLTYLVADEAQTQPIVHVIRNRLAAHNILGTKL